MVSFWTSEEEQEETQRPERPVMRVSFADDVVLPNMKAPSLRRLNTRSNCRMPLKAVSERQPSCELQPEPHAVRVCDLGPSGKRKPTSASQSANSPQASSKNYPTKPKISPRRERLSLSPPVISAAAVLKQSSSSYFIFARDAGQNQRFMSPSLGQPLLMIGLAVVLYLALLHAAEPCLCDKIQTTGAKFSPTATRSHTAATTKSQVSPTTTRRPAADTASRKQQHSGSVVNREHLLSSLAESIERQHVRSLKPVLASLGGQLSSKRPSKFDSGYDEPLDGASSPLAAIASSAGRDVVRKVDESMRQILRMHEQAQPAASEHHSSSVSSSTETDPSSAGLQPGVSTPARGADDRKRSRSATSHLGAAGGLIGRILAQALPSIMSTQPKHELHLPNQSSAVPGSPEPEDRSTGLLSRANKSLLSTKSAAAMATGGSSPWQPVTKEARASLLDQVSSAFGNVASNSLASTLIPKPLNYLVRPTQAPSSTTSRQLVASASNPEPAIVSTLVDDQQAAATNSHAKRLLTSSLTNQFTMRGLSSPFANFASLTPSAVTDEGGGNQPGSGGDREMPSAYSSSASPMTAPMGSETGFISEEPVSSGPDVPASAKRDSMPAGSESGPQSWLRRGVNEMAQRYIRDSLKSILTLSQLPILPSGQISTAPSVFERNSRRLNQTANVVVPVPSSQTTKAFDQLYRYVYMLSTGTRHKKDPLKALGTHANPINLVSKRTHLLNSQKLIKHPSVANNGGNSLHHGKQALDGIVDELLPPIKASSSTASSSIKPSMNPVGRYMSRAKPRGVMWEMASDPTLGVTLIHLMERASVALPLGFLLMPFVKAVRTNPLTSFGHLGSFLPPRAAHRTVDYEELVKRLDIMDRLINRALRPTHREAGVVG